MDGQHLWETAVSRREAEATLVGAAYLALLVQLTRLLTDVAVRSTFWILHVPFRGRILQPA